MELSMLTVALGMMVCFTLPLLIITGVLVIILWRRPKAFDDNVESDATNTNVTMNSIDISKMSRVINSLYIALGLNNIQQTSSMLNKDLSGLQKVHSVANRLSRFGGIHNIEDLGRLTRHLTGVVIVLNPVLNSNKSIQDSERSSSA